MRLDEADELLKAIASNNHYELNEWGLDFCASIADEVVYGRPLTINQSTKLQQIYRKCYGG